MTILSVLLLVFSLSFASSSKNKSDWILRDEVIVTGGGLVPHYVENHPEIGPGFVFGIAERKPFLNDNLCYPNDGAAKIFVPLCTVGFSVEIDKSLKGKLGEIMVEKIKKMEDGCYKNIAEGKAILKTAYQSQERSEEGFWGKEEWEYLAREHKKYCFPVVSMLGKENQNRR